jgi:hypothetical protein
VANTDVLNLQKAVIENPWRNAYWFARMLINGDKYGGVGKDTALLANMCAHLRITLEDRQQDDKTKVKLRQGVIRNILARIMQHRLADVV